MGRLLFFALIAVLVFWALRTYVRGVKKRQEAQQHTLSVEGEDMVRCVHCGVHLPRSESVMAGGEIFCSDEHRRLHAGQ
ncbi:MAG: preprotein translocase subunit YajC [Nitrosospira sp. 56-18]|jgi:uncharacterized protein|nr:preprotein translocase subunit YajC [Nitrosospira sp.]OJY11422.1 MAG: preprotein translocase subunit YajC [Nitrosospira sp. 56-18]